MNCHLRLFVKKWNFSVSTKKTPLVYTTSLLMLTSVAALKSEKNDKAYTPGRSGQGSLKTEAGGREGV